MTCPACKSSASRPPLVVWERGGHRPLGNDRLIEAPVWDVRAFPCRGKWHHVGSEG